MVTTCSTDEVIDLIERNDMSLVLDTVQMLARGYPYSDRDYHYTYTSRRYQELHKANGYVSRMSPKSNCLDNARLKSVFGYLKSDSIFLNSSRDSNDILSNTFAFIPSRFQAKLNNLTPVEYRNKVAWTV